MESLKYLAKINTKIAFIKVIKEETSELILPKVDLNVKKFLI